MELFYHKFKKIVEQVLICGKIESNNQKNNLYQNITTIVFLTLLNWIFRNFKKRANGIEFIISATLGIRYK